MANNRIKKSSPLLTTQGKRLALLGAGALAALALAFAAGVGYGQQRGEKSPAAALAGDPLAALDAPPRGEDPGAAPGAAAEPVKDASASPSDFSFHQALDAPRPGGQPAGATAEKPARVAALPASTPKQGPVLTSSVAGLARDGGAPTSAPPAEAERAPARSPAAPPSPAAPGAAANRPPPGPKLPAASPAQKPKPPRLVASAAKPAPRPEAIPAGAFSVQVGAAQSVDDAQRIAARFKTHRPHIVASDVEGKGRWYRVRLGVFSTRADAARFLRETGVKGFVTAAR
ncbi:MAG TPA: SPOR domain-containing protein [Anaeromyxobacteraceae bacterium]|jgi:cell division protein FtsN|nr:SPOR domain-containing protein [Anaeromyxobacteraceae bacterium]